MRGLFADKIYNTPLQFRSYIAYWNYRLNKKNHSALAGKQHYLAEKPNYGAGIGHQLANWNTSFYYSRLYNLIFAHFPFSNEKWEHFLGFGENETNALTLLKDPGFKKVRLPRFNSENEKEVALIGKIILSYRRDKILFLLEQDQAYARQCDTSADLSRKFFAAGARKANKLLYDAGDFNIAIHIRRGDIVAMKQTGDSNWQERWLNNDYYVAVLKQVLGLLTISRNIRVYLFSQGVRGDFPEFEQFNNIHFCLDTNAYDSFLHLVCADLLISSKSSFSYKPALLSKGIKLCPANFWHAYPASPDFVLVDDNADFDKKKLAEAFEYKNIKSTK